MPSEAKPGSQDAPVAFAYVLAGVAGAVDLICYFALFHIFTAHMSGNTVSTAADLETRRWKDAFLHGFPIPCFVLGVGLGKAIGIFGERRGVSHRLAPTLLLEAGALGAFALLEHVLPLRASPRIDLLLAVSLALPVLAMGLQNASLRHAGGSSVRTTFVTGMLTNFAEDITRALMRAGPLKPALLSGGIWCAYLVGAGAGGGLQLTYGTISILVPAVALVSVALLEPLVTSV